MKVLSYDIELYDKIESDNRDLSKVRPSVAAIATCENDLEYFYDEPYMTKETAQRLVVAITKKMDEGYTPFTWNGTNFDFQLLGWYSGMVDECARLALNAIDGMAMITFAKGYFVSLNAVLGGFGLDGKTHSVKLNDGSFFDEMNGSLAPDLWVAGEYEAVKEYLKGDVLQPLKLVAAIERNHGIKWISKSGKPMFLFSNLKTMRDLFKMPPPDLAWMTDPKNRMDFVSWIPDPILQEFGIRLGS